MIKDRRLQVAAAAGLVLVLAAGASDFVVGSFWERHGMLTSLVANLIVVGVTVAVVQPGRGSGAIGAAGACWRKRCCSR